MLLLFHSIRAPSHGRKCCPRGLHLDNDGRVKRHASRSGTLRGVKPADHVPMIWNRPENRANPATYADARNLCLKRRYGKEVQSVESLQPKGDGVVLICCKFRWESISMWKRTWGTREKATEPPADITRLTDA